MSNLAEMPVRVKVQTLDEFWNERYCEVSCELLKYKLALAATKAQLENQGREAERVEAAIRKDRQFWIWATLVLFVALCVCVVWVA